MNFKNFFRLMLVALLPVWGGGCATSALWSNGNLEDCRMPETGASLRLFNAPQKNDLLVVYKEYSERTGRVRPRAYWVKENEPRIKRGKTPAFVDKQFAVGLVPVTVYQLGSSIPTQPILPYAIVGTNGASFTFFSVGKFPCSYNFLPVYNDGWGKYEKIVITPFAVTADLTIIGGVAVVYVGYWYAASLSRTPVCSSAP
jgi:hypothetical protein